MKRGALILFDGIFLLLLTAVVGLPCAAVAALVQLLVGWWPGWLVALAAPALFLLLLALMIAVAAVISRLLPRLKPGSYAFPGHAQARAWLLHFALQRILHLPLWRPLIFCFAILRTAMLRALGARVALTINASSNATVLDAPLMRIEPGVMLASQVLLSGHFVEGQRLRLGRVELAEGVQVLEGVKIAPDVSVGEYAMIGPESRIADGVSIGEYTHLGAGCMVSSGARIGDNVVLGHRVTVERDAVVEDGAVVQSGAQVPEGQVVPEGTRWPARQG